MRAASCSPSAGVADTSGPTWPTARSTRDGRLVCPWHQSAYDVTTGRMVRGPQGIFAKVPGLGWAFQTLTRVLPLLRGQVVERDGCLYVK